MSTSSRFQSFCNNITIPEDVRNSIQYRYKRITKQLNFDFRSLDSDSQYSLYVGSYGRNTAIDGSDIDMLMRLPYATYDAYNRYTGNGQSALIQEVRRSIAKTYDKTYIRGDGQVAVVSFTDGIKFEIVPCFDNKDGHSFTYPDTHDGGSWKITDPKSEIEAIRERDENIANYNLKRLCRMARVWKKNCSVTISGLEIDTLAYKFVGDWNYKDKSYSYYDLMMRDFLEYLKNQNPDTSYWYAPGSNKFVYRTGNFEYKALVAYNIAIEACKHELHNPVQDYSATTEWQKIFGSSYKNV